MTLKASTLTRYLTVPEVAELARCEHKAVRRAIDAGRLQAFRPTRKILIREEDAQAWIESRPAMRVAQMPEPTKVRPSRARSASGTIARLREMERRAY